MPAKGASASARSPFVVGLYETDTTIEYVVLASFAAHVILTLLVMRVAWSSWLTAKLRAKKETPRSAATLLAAYAVGFVHALVVSAAAIAVTVFERYDVWPPTLAYSLGYFLSDFCFYAAPTLNFPIVIHHIVMVVGHYPVMEREAATLYGAGDAHLITWLSACGYLTEISNLFLDVRWYQLKVQPRTPSNGAYALNAAVLLLTYVLTRIVIMPWATFQYLLPRYDDYVAAGQKTAFYVITGGVAFITLLSTGYTYILLKGGLRSYFTFGKPKPAAANGNGHRKAD